MPKTTKRVVTKRAEKIAKAHATELIVRDAPKQRRPPGYKPPARGLARYPWATAFMVLLIVGLGAWTIYYYHIGPFALPPKKSVTKTVPPPSPFLNLVSQLTATAPP